MSIAKDYAPIIASIIIMTRLIILRISRILRALGTPN